MRSINLISTVKILCISDVDHDVRVEQNVH